MITTLQAATIDHFGTGNDELGQARRIAGKMFDQAYAKARRASLWAKLTGTSRVLDKIPPNADVDRNTTGIQLVSMNDIIGSEGRNEDFDKDFRPLKMHDRERWIGVAAARRMGIALPAVELIQVRDNYYVRDGHHRISVAKAAGQREIDARIVN